MLALLLLPIYAVVSCLMSLRGESESTWRSGRRPGDVQLTIARLGVPLVAVGVLSGM
jgi:hypothetical protein